MLHALYDTTVVSYWWLGQPEFAGPILGLETELAEAGMTFCVSAVSMQELFVASQMAGPWRGWHAWLCRRFAVLPFLERHAKKAAWLQVEAGCELVGTKAQRRDIKDIWFRDAAIAGTAIEEDFDVIVSADKGFRKYQKNFRGEVRIIEPDSRWVPKGV